MPSQATTGLLQHFSQMQQVGQTALSIAKAPQAHSPLIVFQPTHQGSHNPLLLPNLMIASHVFQAVFPRQFIVQQSIQCGRIKALGFGCHSAAY